MEKCQTLKVLSLTNVEMDENDCRVLGTYSRPSVEIELTNCRITGAGASALVVVLGRNQGPTKLDLCYIVNLVLTNGLRGNSRLKSFAPRLSSNPEIYKQENLAIAGALKENKGLLDLNVWQPLPVSDEAWDAICDSLKTHPTLESLELQRVPRDPLSLAVLNSRIQALVDMMKVNMSIHTIHLRGSNYSEHELFQRSVIPYLERNWFWPRVLAIQKTRPTAYRAKVLGRSLLDAFIAEFQIIVSMLF
jgi:hypothetical protein